MLLTSRQLARQALISENLTNRELVNKELMGIYVSARTTPAFQHFYEAFLRDFFTISVIRYFAYPILILWQQVLPFSRIFNYFYNKLISVRFCQQQKREENVSWERVALRKY